jgi:hypothetical protein
MYVQKRASFIEQGCEATTPNGSGMFIEIVLDQASGSQAAVGVFRGTLAELEEKRSASVGFSGVDRRGLQKSTGMEPHTGLLA